jgi:hypothetical protein
MVAGLSGLCRCTPCLNVIPSSLADQEMCLEHFLDEAFDRTEAAMEQCREGRAIDSKRLERLLSDALTIVNNLEEDSAAPNQEDRERMLELLFSLANLHEYAAHHALSLGPVS